MTPEKRKKIKALMESPASTENEKAICRKLLKDNPATESQVPLDMRFIKNWETPRSQESGDFWRQNLNSQQQAAARQQAAAQGQDRAAAARQQAATQQAWGLFGQAFRGGVGGLFGGIGQQASNDFMSELARIMAEDMKKGKK